MEEAYTTAKYAVLRLVSNKGGEDEYRDKGEVLHSVLQRRPVVLGFVISLIARKLQGSNAARTTHEGVRVALEVVLAFYDPRTPQNVTPIISALDEDSLQAHLTATRGEDLVLPWLARLSLVHACLAGGRAGGKKWGWLLSAADSACSAALEALSTESCTRAKASLGMGKGPARLSSAESRSTGDTFRAGTVSAAMASQVCADLAAAVSTVGVQIEGAFLGSGGPEPQVHPGRFVGGLPLGCLLGECGEGWVQAFRFKLEALRNALSAGTVSDATSTGRQGMHSLIPRAPAQGKLIAVIRAVEVRRDSVTRALNRSHCGDALVLAVEAAFEAEEPPLGNSENRKRKISGTETVQLVRALETCLFDVGLPSHENEGHVRPSAADVAEVDYQARPSNTAGGVDRQTPWLTATDTEAHRACAVLQGFLSEGVRIRDLMLALLAMGEREESWRKRAPMEGARSKTGADIVASVQPPCEVRRVKVYGVVLAFVGWVANNAWLWEAAQDAAEVNWEGDLAAAAAAAVVACWGSPVAERNAYAGSINSLLEGERVEHGSPTSRVVLKRSDDCTELLDRLVAGATAVIIDPRLQSELNWADVLRRVTACAGSVSLSTYAAVCVERSVALSGHAPFAVAERHRLGQVEGYALWRLLKQACMSQGNATADGRARAEVSVLVRTAAAAVASCRRVSCPWMIPSGLLGSGPVRLVTDMLLAACGSIHASDVLDGLVARPGKDGPLNLAADLFAAFVSAGAEQCEAVGKSEDGDNAGNGLRLQAVSWLGNALSGTRSTVRSAASLPTRSGTAASANLARVFTRRIPYEAKVVVVAVKEAVELVAIKGRIGAWSSTTGGRVSEQRESSAMWRALASLGEVARNALPSSLLPLPLSISSTTASLAERCVRENLPGAGAPRARSGRKQPVRTEKSERKFHPEATAVTAGLLLDAFEQRPEAITRAIRGAVRSGECDQELFSVQGALRTALCSQPALDDHQRSTSSAANSIGDTADLLSATSGCHRARACLLVGHLVESGALGWEETKASMAPPPRELLEAAEACIVRKEGANVQCRDSSSRHPLTALRLELWLRALCHSHLRHRGLDPCPTFQIPDVFRTARTLARAISRYVDFLVTSSPHGEGQPLNGSPRFHSVGSSMGARGNLSPLANGAKDSLHYAGIPQDGASDSSEQTRRALFARLRGAPSADALVSWVSRMVHTVRQFREWLPWQAFADELRNLLQLSVREPPARGMYWEGRAAPAEPVAVVAGAYAMFEVLLAWEGVKEAAADAVFGPKLCSTALHTATAPVASHAGPPLWLDVLRCLLDETGRSLASWMQPRTDCGEQSESFAMTAAAAVWIGGGESGAGAVDSRHEAWVLWYGEKLGSLISASRGGCGKFLVLAGAGAEGVGRVEVRAGPGWEGHVIEEQKWEDWGRSPLQAAWNFPSRVGAKEYRPDTELPPPLPPPPIILPPFAAWLRVVLNSRHECREGRLAGYLRRMAREVYLPCEFRGASGEMARQWLAALIEAEIAADGEATEPASLETARSINISGESSPSERPTAVAAARRRAVKAFFHEELLRFGGGDAPVAPVGGPLTWLWPLEAVITACGRAGPLGGGMRARHRSLSKDSQDRGVASKGVHLDGTPSALARALCAIPHDLLCGSRRFGGGGGRPPPATLRAFTTRAVDLLARALATPPCRHWSVARQLILGLGLLYHALARPESGSVKRRGEADPTAGGTYALNTGGSRVASEAAAAQVAALATIESLIRIALGLDGENEGNLNGSHQRTKDRDRVAAACKPLSTALPSSCRSLRPLETAGSGGAQELAEALTSAGAWRTTGVFVRRNDASRCPPCVRPTLVGCSECRRPSPSREQPPGTRAPVVGSQANGTVAATPVDVAKTVHRDAGTSRSCTSFQDVLSEGKVSPSQTGKAYWASAARSNGDPSTPAAEETASSPTRRVLPPRTATRSERSGKVRRRGSSQCH